MPARFFSFGAFKLVPDQQRLLCGDVPVRLGTRALAILSVLVEHAGELISKQDLMSRVWPDTFVAESNLKVNIAALRKALDGDNPQLSHIATVSGRGYRFVALVIVGELENSLESRRRVRVSNLPISTKHIFGRCEVIQQVMGQLSRCRFLTIVGPGGIGKTTVSTAVAESLLQAYEHGICFRGFFIAEGSEQATTCNLRRVTSSDHNRKCE
jgi:DNA-binding winged helix-turn-helix (wHTH) protein